MTRVNLVHPSELCDKQLFAEFREITRIPNVIISDRFTFTDQPEHYVLGKGHVKFFYDKLTFLHNRYAALYVELKHIRLYNVEYLYVFTDIYKEPYYCYWNDYIPKYDEIELNKQRK